MTPLHAAAFAGDASTIERLLNSGSNVDGADPEFGLTALAVAASKDHVDVVNLLLSKGADVNRKGNDGRQALHLAAQFGHMGAAEQLIARGADVNAAEANGYTPLHFAAKTGKSAMIELLLSKGANINATERSGKTAFSIAASENHRDAVAALERRGGSDSPSYIPLIFALKHLRIRFFPGQLRESRLFAASTCLMRGDEVIPGVEGASPLGGVKPPPQDPMEAMLKAQFPNWPEAVVVAVKGIFAFGPGNMPVAEQCARYSLSLDTNCLLAKQLLKMLEAPGEYRVAPSAAGDEVRDALSKMAGQ